MCPRSIAGALNEQGWDLIALSGHNGPRRILAILNRGSAGPAGGGAGLQCRSMKVCAIVIAGAMVVVHHR